MNIQFLFKQQVTALTAMLLIMSTSAMARSSPDTVLNDPSNSVEVVDNTCDADFPDSRLCTTEEVVNSTKILPIGSGVNPVTEPTQTFVLPEILVLSNGTVKIMDSE